MKFDYAAVRAACLWWRRYARGCLRCGEIEYGDEAVTEHLTHHDDCGCLRERIVAVFKSLGDTMAFDPRDHSVNKRDAWTYAIVCGWRGALNEVAAIHKWDADAVARLRKLRATVAEIMGEKE